MASNTITSYLAWITPTPGDPTYTLLRAHLIFEQLLDTFLKRTLVHPGALTDARFTFAQKLAISRAVASGIAPSDWTWQAVVRLNKIRNTLAHSPGPKLSMALHEYVEYCVKHSGSPMPAADSRSFPMASTSPSHESATYTAADMATVGLYIRLASRLGFEVDAFTGSGNSA